MTGEEKYNGCGLDPRQSVLKSSDSFQSVVLLQISSALVDAAQFKWYASPVLQENVDGLRG